MSEHALVVDGLVAGYGNSDALRSVDLVLPRNQVTAVVGPNGAGKSTLMKVLAGVHPSRAGTTRLFGRDVTGADARERLASGLSLCPERRRVFPAMSVEENLLMGAVTVKPALARQRVQQAYDRFPWLAERRRAVAGNLSGGQQQMLAISRAIMTQPALLCLDEPSLGLSPRVVQEVAELIRELAAGDMTVLIVEQNVSLGLKLADHMYVLNRGEIVRAGSAAELRRDTELVDAYLG
jgi:branched-chain amino acid transport system ATP-binding protein